MFCRKFSSKARIRRGPRAPHVPHLPHQFVHDGRMNFAASISRNFGIFPGNYFTNLGASARMFRGDGSQDTFTNLLKTNFLDDQKKLAETQSNNQNLMLLSDQSSHSTKVSATRSRGLDYTSAGLAVAALNINLSSLAPLYSVAVSNPFKEMNSSSRVSRAASPAFGNSAENNRLHIGFELHFF